MFVRLKELATAGSVAAVLLTSTAHAKPRPFTEAEIADRQAAYDRIGTAIEAFQDQVAPDRAQRSSDYALAALNPSMFLRRCLEFSFYSLEAKLRKGRVTMTIERRDRLIPVRVAVTTTVIPGSVTNDFGFTATNVAREVTHNFGLACGETVKYTAKLGLWVPKRKPDFWGSMRRVSGSSAFPEWPGAFTSQPMPNPAPVQAKTTMRASITVPPAAQAAMRRGTLVAGLELTESALLGPYEERKFWLLPAFSQSGVVPRTPTSSVKIDQYDVKDYPRRGPSMRPRAEPSSPQVATTS